VTTIETGVRCSDWARAEGIDPIGTSGSYDGYLLVEWPLPWPRDLGDVEELTALQPMLREARCRLQGLVAQRGDERRRVVHYRRPPGDGFVRYQRSERVATAETVADVAAELLSAPVPDDAWDGRPDVLVCTHGRRDRCCGSLGTPLATELESDPTALAGARLWRTSHTGGHRFAPTAILLPEGTAWAYADTDVLSRVVSRTGPIDDLLPRYRGCAGLGSRAVQALERAVLAEVGWPLLGSPRWGTEEADGTVTLVVDAPAGPARWSAEVAAGRQVPLPDCGAGPESAKKSDQELVVRRLRRF
jgi:hypothetical protein